MTYPPGGPGYPTTQPQYNSAPSQQFDRAGDPASAASTAHPGASKFPVYLGAAVTVLALAIYVTSFGPLFGARSATPGFFLVVAPLLAGLVAGVGLLPKQADRSAIAAVLAVLGFLLIVFAVLGGGPAVGWAFYPYIIFSVFQVVAAVWHLLLQAGVVTAPTPKPRAEPSPYGPYGPPPQYYGQPSYGGPGQQPGYQPQYGGYQGGGPNAGGVPALGRSAGPANGPENGPPTPPTGFPAFGHPQAAGGSPLSADPQQSHLSTQQQPSQQSAPPPS